MRSEKHDNSSSEETKVTEEKSDEKIGEDFHADVEAGLLWINKQGRVTDKDGNIIDAYSYITANDRKTLISDGDIMAGYTMTDDMQIIIDEEYISMTEEDSVGDTDYSYTLLSIADPSVKGRQMTVSEEKNKPVVGAIYTPV